MGHVLWIQSVVHCLCLGAIKILCAQQVKEKWSSTTQCDLSHQVKGRCCFCDSSCNHTEPKDIPEGWSALDAWRPDANTASPQPGPLLLRNLPQALHLDLCSLAPPPLLTLTQAACKNYLHKSHLAANPRRLAQKKGSMRLPTSCRIYVAKVYLPSLKHMGSNEKW